MTKKFISLLLSVVLVLGLMPSMSITVSAAGETKITFDDFESYSVGVAANSAGTNTSLSVNGVNKWTLSKYTHAEIVSMPGYDGTTTKALKFINNYFTDKYSADGYRLKAEPQSTYKSLSGKLYVQEYRIWLPADVTSSGTTDYKKPKAITLGYNTAIKNGDDLYIYDTSTGYTLPTEQWVKITAVADYTNWSKAADPVTYAVFANDEIVYYNPDDTSAICEPATDNKATRAYWFISSGYSETDVHDQHFYIDDVNIYYGPNKTTVSSIQSDATNVSSKVSPTINFTEKVLSTTIHSDGEISAEKNIEFYKSTDSSATVEINEPTLSADGKTLTIDPVNELESGVEYTVTVKNLKDMYGRDIPSATFSFTTAEASAITVSQPVFSRENLFVAGASQAITTLENGYIKVSSTVNNSANTAKDVLVLAMLKDGDDIKYFQFKNITVPATGSATFTGGFQVDNASTQKIETVVWDSIYNKTPLADKYEFSSSGFNKTVLEDLLGE